METLDYDKSHWKQTPCPKVDCRKDACKCGLENVFLSAALGDDSEESPVAPKKGNYCNAIVVYEANGHIYLYSKEGIPTLITTGGDYAEVIEEIQERLGQVENGLSQEIIDRIAGDRTLQDEIDAIKNSPDVVDVVATYAALQAYDTSGLGDNDIVRVLQDEQHGGASTYYRWNKQSNTWAYIGEVGDYYTKGQVDDLLDDKQDTLTAGENITIENNVISATGGGGIKTLTADDYNYPTDNPNTVALWLLDDGLYMLPGAGSTVSVTGALSGGQLSAFNRMFTNHEVLYVLKHGYQFWMFKTASSSYGPLGNYSGFYKCSINSVGNFSFDKTYQTMTFEQLYNDLTTTTAGNGALDASQGRVLKNLIDSLVITGAGAPTTSTTGTVGQLYEDTTNGKLYQCTAASGGTYTWEEVGAGGGGGGDTVYSTKTTSNGADSGAVYIGGKNASQEIYPDPTTTDNHWKYFWALPFKASETGYTFVPGDETINIGGTQTAGGSDNVTLGYRSQSLGSHNVNIGWQAGSTLANGSCVCVGDSASCEQNYAVALGREALVKQGHTGSVALGPYSKTTRQGEVYVGPSSTFAGFNSTNYRVIGGVYDGQDAHDAATLAQGNTLATSAPTTSTVGVLGQLYTDTTNMHTYQCTAISGSTYTWTQRW